ncbi:AraC family transcriptional regulator [Pseudomonas sp. SL4(2022)]|uniref:AraC family transcriptional regulator n=1 Tax=Pseudomonas sp. SL4(2022) TaxID=2994661 RepID=UPI00226EBBE5|nr:AraC family transcriptional regulator [Pseudomonas sp. SL4(2022)]WAC44844.1 AraC family transcriptional regulator [Pseudomonas sp. SL4(2022)]
MHSLLSLRHYSHELLSHSHDHAQLVFGLSGLLEFEVAGQGSQITRQTLAVVPSDAQHACGSKDGSHCLVLDVPDERWLQQQLGRHLDATRRLLDKPTAVSLTPAQSQLVSWLAASPINDPVIAQQGAALLLASLANGETPAQTVNRLPLAALDVHIDQHAAYPLQVDDLARLAGLSAARFHVHFLSETGQTPMDYVRRRRLQLARQLLQNSNLAIGEIAARVGYSSQSAFTAALTRQFGCSARALRLHRE